MDVVYQSVGIPVLHPAARCTHAWCQLVTTNWERTAWLIVCLAFSKRHEPCISTVAASGAAHLVPAVLLYSLPSESESNSLLKALSLFFSGSSSTQSPSRTNINQCRRSKQGVRSPCCGGVGARKRPCHTSGDKRGEASARGSCPASQYAEQVQVHSADSAIAAILPSCASHAATGATSGAALRSRSCRATWRLLGHKEGEAQKRAANTSVSSSVRGERVRARKHEWESAKRVSRLTRVAPRSIKAAQSFSRCLLAARKDWLLWWRRRRRSRE